MIRKLSNKVFRKKNDISKSPTCEYHMSTINKLLSPINSLIYPPDNFRYYRAHWQGITGWLQEEQANWLFNQAKRTDINGDILEIGSAWGRSSICLGMGIRLASRDKVYCVDPHTGSEGFRNQLGKAAESFSSLDGFRKNVERFNLEDFIIPVVSTSEEAAQKWHGAKLRLVFIDGWHSYDAVRTDILSWAEYIVPRGIIALHDYQHEGVRRAIHSCMEELNLDESRLRKVDSQMVFFEIV